MRRAAGLSEYNDPDTFKFAGLSYRSRPDWGLISFTAKVFTATVVNMYAGYCSLRR